MSTPRVRRLQSDFNKLQELDSRSPYIKIKSTEGEPPEKYIVELRCKGISKLDSNNNPVYADTFNLVIQLQHDYPSKAPLFEILAEQTPIYHPNIGAGGLVCIGDAGDHGWSPALSLDDVVIRIIQMIRYENVGFESPFNMFANEWAQKNTHLFPLDTTHIITEDSVVITLLDDVADNATSSATNNVSSATSSNAADNLVDDDLLQDIIIH